MKYEVQTANKDKQELFEADSDAEAMVVGMRLFRQWQRDGLTNAATCRLMKASGDKGKGEAKSIDDIVETMRKFENPN